MLFNFKDDVVEFINFVEFYFEVLVEMEDKICVVRVLLIEFFFVYDDGR